MEMVSYASILVGLHGILVAEGFSCGVTKIPIADGFLNKLTKISKYFVYVDMFDVNGSDYETNYMEAKEICLAGGLSMADIQDEADLESLRNFVSASKGSYWIGLNDIQKEGQFLDGDGNTIKFQAFLPGSPDGGEEENCVTISGRNSSQYMSMEDEDCLSIAGVLCQYHSDSFCFANSFQAVAGRRQFRRPESVKMHISQSQKTHVEAEEECTTRNGSLLSISNFETALQLQVDIKKYHNSTNQNPDTSYWISGSLFKSAELFPDYNTKVTEEDFEHLFGSYGTCTEIFFTSIEALNSQLPIIRPAICSLPKYYICIGDHMASQEFELEESEIDEILQNFLQDSLEF